MASMTCPPGLSVCTHPSVVCASRRMFHDSNPRCSTAPCDALFIYSRYEARPLASSKSALLGAETAQAGKYQRGKGPYPND